MNQLRIVQDALRRKLEDRTRLASARLVLAYAVVAAAWIALSDIWAVSVGITGQRWATFNAVAGAGFVVLTSAILYTLLDRYANRIAQAERELLQQENLIRQAYVDVLSAVTGGKLMLVSQDEVLLSLGPPLGVEHRLEHPSELAEARRTIRESVRFRARDLGDSPMLLSPVGEALNNALKHGGTVAYQVHAFEDTIQVRVEDDGPGIDFRTLPKAALVTGFSTTATLGIGFTIMLQTCERVLIATAPGQTTIVLEFHAGAESLAPAYTAESAQPALINTDLTAFEY